MNKISAAGINAANQALLEKMQQSAILASTGLVDGVSASAFGSSSPVSFATVLNQAIDNVDAVQQSANAKQKAIEMGLSDDLAGAMIESQKASVTFSALVQVRNKLTTALDEVINIPL